MSDNTTRRGFLAITGSTAAVALAGCSSTDGGSPGTATMEEGMTGTESMDDEGMNSDPTTITVRVENVASSDFYGSETSTSGAIWITPGAYAVHTADNPIHTDGEEASEGLEALAEAGKATGFEDGSGLVDELSGMDDDSGVVSSGSYDPDDTVEDPNDPMGEVPGANPIAPEGAFEFDIEAEPGDKLSLASMFVPSNDIYFAPGSDGISLWPEDGDPVDGDVTDSIELWDAGTESNQAPGEGADQAPSQESPDQGDDEGGVIQLLEDVDDGYDYPDVSDAIQVTLTPVDSMDDS